MKKYDRSAIKNTDNRTAITKQNKNETFKKKKNSWWSAVDPKIKKECYRVANLTKRFTEIYEENPNLFTEQHIVLQVFLSTCSMASCSFQERWNPSNYGALETNEAEEILKPWILNDTERYILNFVKSNYPLEWTEMLHEGKGVQYWYPPVLGPATYSLGLEPKDILEKLKQK